MYHEIKRINASLMICDRYQVTVCVKYEPGKHDNRILHVLSWYLGGPEYYVVLGKVYARNK